MNLGRVATAEDRGRIAQHVLKNYLTLVEHDPFEWLHQIKAATHSFPHLFDNALFSEGLHLIYEKNNTIIATAGLVPVHDQYSETKWKMVSVYVDKEYRGRSIGENLVREIIKHARDRGIKYLTLITLPLHMPEAGKLYTKVGFVFKNELQASKLAGTNQPRNMKYHVYELHLL